MWTFVIMVGLPACKSRPKAASRPTTEAAGGIYSQYTLKLPKSKDLCAPQGGPEKQKAAQADAQNGL